MQHEITQAIPLLDEQGELTQPGVGPEAAACVRPLQGEGRPSPSEGEGLLSGDEPPVRPGPHHFGQPLHGMDPSP